MDKLEKILENLPYPAYAIDSGGKVVIWNRKSEEVSGVSREEVLGTAEYWRVYGERVKTPAEEILESTDTKKGVTRVVNAGGRKFLSSAFEVDGIVVEIIEDVTELENLRRKVELFRKLVRHIKHFGMHTKKEDLERTFVGFTKDLIGTDVCELYMKVGKNYRLVTRNPPFPGDEIVGEKHPMVYCVESCEVCELGGEGNKFTREFGRTVLVPLVSSEGIEGFAQFKAGRVDRERFDLWRTILSAIMRRLRVEEELVEKINWFETVIKTVNCGIVFVDCETGIVYSSERFREMAGIECEGVKLLDHIESGKAEFQRAMEASMRGEDGEGFCTVCLNSRDFYVRVRMITSPGRDPVFCCIFKHKDCEKEITNLYSGIVREVTGEKSHRRAASILCRKMLNLSCVEQTWFYSFVNRNFYSPNRRLMNYLKRYSGDVTCLGREMESGRIIECTETTNCPVRRFYREKVYYVIPATCDGELQYLFGIVSSRKLDRRAVRALEDAVKLFSLKMEEVVNRNRFETLVEDVRKVSISKIRQKCDKILNLLTSVYCYIDGLIDKNYDEVEIVMPDVFDIVVDVYNRMKEVKQLEDELIEMLENIKKSGK